MPDVQIIEIAAGTTMYSATHKQNVKVVKVHADTADIEITKDGVEEVTKDTVKHSDLSKKQK